MLKRIRARATTVGLGAALLIAFGSATAVGGAIFARSEYGIRYIPQSTVPPNCKNPDKLCTWANSADNNLYLHTPAGTEVPATLSVTGVTAGTYTNASVTFDSYGRVTAASAGAAPGSGGYNALLANASPVTSRSTLNFVGPDNSCADNSGSARTDCTLGPQIITATFTAVDHVSLSWSNRGGTQSVFVGTPVVTDGLGGVTFYVTGMTSTGATLNASAPWTGTVAVQLVSR